MFGIIVSGQLVQTNFEQVGETQFVVNLVDVFNVKHVVIFLTGKQPFPPSFGGAVYLSLPESNSPPTWHLLGVISNEKPSTIFKIVGLKSQIGDLTQNPFSQHLAQQHAQVGISIEPMTQISGLTPATNVEPSTVNSFLEFSNCMCENLFNYASSFAVAPNRILPTSTQQFIPFSVLVQWYENFKRKLEHNPHFWKK